MRYLLRTETMQAGMLVLTVRFGSSTSFYIWAPDQ